MKIDILSDTHFDSWFGYPRTESPTFFPSKDSGLVFAATAKEVCCLVQDNKIA